MKMLLITTCAVMFCFAPSQTWAQNCKPDVSREDKISKERITVVGITATIGRCGSLNAVNLQIQKREDSATNAQFESAYRAAVGKPFYFGFKNGDPLAFVVTEVGNEAKVQQSLFFAAKGVTTVILSAVLQDNELATLRDALTTRQIDAIRMVLAGDLRIEKSVNDKNGKKMMEKFSCFYQSLDKRGIDLSAAGSKTQSGQSASVADIGVPPRDYAGSAPGKYVSKRTSSDFLDLSTEECSRLAMLGGPITRQP